MAWDDLTRDGGSWAEPGVGYYALLLQALPAHFDRAPTVPPDTFVKAQCYAVGRELMRLRYALDWLSREGSAATTVDRLADWELLLGLAVRPDLDAETRRALVLERYAGRDVSPGLYLLTIALRELDVETLTVIPRPGKWVVYKLPERGWIGQEPIDRTQAHLARAGSAGFDKAILAWDDPMGLTGEQMNGLHGSALDEANAAFDLNGRPSSIDYLSSDALDALSFDAIDALEA
jgi:hypothetical protein